MSVKQRSDSDIPETILDEMALECSKDEAFQEKLYLAYDKASLGIRTSVDAARLQVSGAWIPDFPESKEQKDTKKRLKRFLGKARAYSEELKAAEKDEGLALGIEVAMYSSDPKRIGSIWQHIDDLEVLLGSYSKREVSSKRLPKGRPNELKRLENFTYEIAQLYQVVTNEKFTVDRFVDSDGIKFISKGQSFAYKAFLFLVDGYHPYTLQNFQNACVYVSKRLKEESLTRNEVRGNFL